MLVKKARKPRGIKLNGERSYDMCPCCLSFNCDPMTNSHKFQAKLDKRSDAGQCRSCGSVKCKCKSSL